MNPQIDNYCINPAVLKWARLTIGYDLITASKKLGISVETLEKWENGSEEAPVQKIKILADVYKRATTVFLLNVIPEENVSPSFRKLLYDNLESFSTDTLLAIRKAIRIQNLALDAFGLKQNQFLVDLRNLEIKPGEYEKTALEIINLLGLSEDLITKPKGEFEQLNLWKNAIEAKGIYILELGFNVDEAKGFAIYDSIAPVIVLNTNDTPKVRVFTLLHELSHFVMQTDAIDDNESIFSYNKNKVETICNYIAGSIIVPSSFLNNKLLRLQINPQENIEMTIDILSRVFNVSKQVLLRRLFITDNIDKDNFVKYQNVLRDNYLSSKHVKKKQTGGDFYVKYMKNNSKAFVYDVLDAYRVKRIGYGDVLNFLNLKSSTLTKLEARL